MTFADVYLVTDKLKRVPAEEVDAAEAALGTTFPPGYREFITPLGEGSYCGYVSLFTPERVVRGYNDPRSLLKEFASLWQGLDPRYIAASLHLGSSMDGDMIIWHPKVPDDVYVLPRHGVVAHHTGPALGDALNWLCAPSGQRRFRWFDSEIDSSNGRVPSDLNLTYDELRRWLLALQKHDHIEETTLNGTSPGMAVGLLQGYRVQIAEPAEETEMIMFFRCFAGYVLCFIDMFGRMNIQIRYDAGLDDGTARQIISFLQSAAA